MLHPAPIPGMPMRTPAVSSGEERALPLAGMVPPPLAADVSCPSSWVQVPPAPGMVLLGYEVYSPPAGCCMCDGLSPAGLISVM